MSRQESEKRYTQKPTKKSQNETNKGNFVSFHPTEAEKRTIADENLTAGQAMDSLEEEVKRGLSFGLSRTRTGDAYCITVKPLGYVHGEDQCLACFHSNLTRVLALTVYMLTVKYPQWPEKPVTSFQQELDW